MTAPRRKRFVILVLFLLLGVPTVWVLLWKNSRFQAKRLPIMFERELDEKGDTVYHTIGDYRLTDQNGSPIGPEKFDNCVYVANFFYATCPDICPRMNQNMRMVAEKFRDAPNVRFISHTVDPLNDTLPVLKEYARLHNANQLKWSFVTGSKAVIYRLAAVDYRVVAVQEQNSNFIHSDRLVLIDKEKRVRAVFDGLAGPAENEKLIDAIKALLIEYKDKDKHDQR